MRLRTFFFLFFFSLLEATAAEAHAKKMFFSERDVFWDVCVF